MKILAMAMIAAAGLAMSMPANAHMRCGWQWPNDDVYANTVRPTFAGNDCMANQLNRDVLMNNTQILVPMPR
jgi:hypothetical protein